MNDAHTCRITLLQGSVRPGNYTAMAAAILADEFSKRPEVALEVIDPTGMELPLPGAGGSSEDAKRIRAAVKEATGVVFATPEYHGSFSSVTKLLIDNLGYPSALKGKPMALMGVAAGRIGAIKALEHLRSVVSHVGAIVLPGPVSVANVRGVFDKEGRVLDEGIEAQIRGIAPQLLEHIARCVCPEVSLEEMVRGNC